MFLFSEVNFKHSVEISLHIFNYHNLQYVF